MKLAVGTMVAYPPHGVGRISAREKKVVLGVEEEVVVIELGNELSVTLPVSRATDLLRPPATEADLKKVQKTLREDGVVNVYSRTVHILDWNALAKLGEFDADYLQADIKPEERIRIVEAARGSSAPRNGTALSIQDRRGGIK